MNGPFMANFVMNGPFITRESWDFGRAAKAR